MPQKVEGSRRFIRSLGVACKSPSFSRLPRALVACDGGFSVLGSGFVPETPMHSSRLARIVTQLLAMQKVEGSSPFIRS